MLPITFWIKFKIALLTSKILRTGQPSYLHSILSKSVPNQARSSRGGAKECLDPSVHFNFFVVSSCRMQGSVSKVNVRLRIWIGMGHKTCTLWHGVYLTPPPYVHRSSSYGSQCAFTVCVWLPWALDLHHMYTCTVSPANNPSHIYHEGWNVNTPTSNLTGAVQNTPSLPGGGGDCWLDYG